MFGYISFSRKTACLLPTAFNSSAECMPTEWSFFSIVFPSPNDVTEDIFFTFRFRFHFCRMLSRQATLSHHAAILGKLYSIWLAKLVHQIDYLPIA